MIVIISLRREVKTKTIFCFSFTEISKDFNENEVPPNNIRDTDYFIIFEGQGKCVLK
jgi:hypothetical protein